jgi:hypothetical protein
MRRSLSGGTVRESGGNRFCIRRQNAALGDQAGHKPAGVTSKAWLATAIHPARW